MKIVKTEFLIKVGGFPNSDTWVNIQSDIIQAIKSIEWPKGSGSFTLFSQSGKKRGEGNGVKPIKEACMQKLVQMGWVLEKRIDVASAKHPGPMDAVYQVDSRFFCVEWETGNISSSHRAINKMALGILKKKLVGGLLIVPTREMYKYLTDRVGNFPELEPYFLLWKSIVVDEGLLAIMAIEHDAISTNVPRIKKGTDGRALL